MTNKEAIDYLAIIYERSRNGKRAYHNKYQDAFDMAIEALKIEPCDDVVSRKAAIEAVEFGITYAKAIDVNTGESKELFKEGNDALKKASERIKDLPSAQPETHEERTETHSCDLIDRQAAIDAHYEYCNKHPDAGFPVWSLKILEDLPSAQPEIVRCKDCIFHGFCRTSPKWAVAPKDDWYCADAGRRTDEADYRKE